MDFFYSTLQHYTIDKPSRGKTCYLDTGKGSWHYGLQFIYLCSKINRKIWQDLEFELIKLLENDELFSTMESLTSRIENAELTRISELYKAVAQTSI